MDLNDSVCYFTAQPIGSVVAHGRLYPKSLLDLHMGYEVHLCNCFADKKSKHLALSDELDQGKLDALVVGKGLAEGFAGTRVFDGLVDAEFGS